jgi:hypothetical protein
MAFTASSITTELDAVNILLMSIGEATVTAIDSNDSYEVDQAQDIIAETVRELCDEPYIFNTEFDVSLSLDGNSKIPVATNIAMFVPNDAGKNVVIRDGFLYDLDNSTYIFSDAISGTVVYLRDFDELPEAAKRYVIMRASRRYNQRFVGSQTIQAYTQQEEIEAHAKLIQYQAYVDRLNLLTDSASVSKVVNRRSGRRPGKLF